MPSKKFVFSFFFLLTVLGAACSRPETAGFDLSGRIENPPQGQVTLIQEIDINRKQSRPVAIVPVEADGTFNLDLDLPPHIYTLDLYGKKKITLAVDSGQKIVIEADGRDLSAARVSGSEDTARLEAYEKFRKESLDRLVNRVRDRIKQLKEANDGSGNAEELERLNRLEVENYDKHRDELIEFVKNEMGTSIAIYATSLRWDGDRHLDFLQSLAASFERAHPGLAVTEKLKEKVEILKNTSVGGKAPEISLPDQSGKKVPLSAAGGKYTLIDFWASWCGPCRRESGTLSELYDRYRERGLEIYGVSLDESRDVWLAAIEQDDRKWPNVASFRGFETPTAFDYAVTALPANFIIDADGKIVAKNLHGESLRETVEKLFAE
ncbi:MAG: TlpA disulfide reductase family protein [Pyrinomonadaceae bacterium]